MDNQTQSKLQNAFMGNTGYQQPNQVAPISQPVQTAIMPTPEDAAAATRARMAARNPMAAPATAPRTKQYDPMRGGNGSAGGRGSGGAW